MWRKFENGEVLRSRGDMKIIYIYIYVMGESHQKLFYKVFKSLRKHKITNENQLKARMDILKGEKTIIQI